MDLFTLAGVYALIVSVLGACLGLLLVYGIIRVAVARGMRDHYLWLEKNRPSGPQAVAERDTIGQYFGFSRGGRAEE